MKANAPFSLSSNPSTNTFLEEMLNEIINLMSFALESLKSNFLEQFLIKI